MANITVELDEKYREHLDLLKQIIPDIEGNEITEDGKMVEGLIDSFMSFLQQQAEAHDHGDGCGCGHEH